MTNRSIKEQIIRGLPKNVIKFLISNNKLSEFLTYSCKYFKKQSLKKDEKDLSYVILNESDALSDILNYGEVYVKEGVEYWIDLFNYYRLKYHKTDKLNVAKIISVDFTKKYSNSIIINFSLLYMNLIHKNSKAYKIIQDWQNYTDLELAIALSKTRVYLQIPDIYKESLNVINYFKNQKNEELS